MKVLLLKDDEWQEYRKELLDKDQAYKFVAWVAKGVVLVAPVKIRGGDFYHKDIVEYAMDKGVINWEFRKPVAYGRIRPDLGQDGDNRIISWDSAYGDTKEEFMPQVREALGLEDVVYKN